MSDLRKFADEKRKFELDLSGAMSPDTTLYSVQSISATPEGLDIEIVDITTNTVEFFVLMGEPFQEYDLKVLFRTAAGEDLESRFTLLVR